MLQVVISEVGRKGFLFFQVFVFFLFIGFQSLGVFYLCFIYLIQQRRLVRVYVCFQDGKQVLFRLLVLVSCSGCLDGFVEIVFRLFLILQERGCDRLLMFVVGVSQIYNFCNLVMFFYYLDLYVQCRGFLINVVELNLIYLEFFFC